MSNVIVIATTLAWRQNSRKAVKPSWLGACLSCGNHHHRNNVRSNAARNTLREMADIKKLMSSVMILA